MLGVVAATGLGLGIAYSPLGPSMPSSTTSPRRTTPTDPPRSRPPPRHPPKRTEICAAHEAIGASANLLAAWRTKLGHACNDTHGLRWDTRCMHTGRPPQIVAFGGGGFSMEAGNPLLDDYVLVARRSASGRRSASCRPPPATPTTTSSASTARSRRAARPRTSRCSAATAATARSRATSRRTCSQQDLIYVGGGSVVSLLGAWRAHGLDRVLREAWRRGVVLCGLSRRLAVLVPGGRDRVPRRADGRARARPAAALQLRPLRRRAGAARGVPPLRRRRRHARLRRRRRRRAALRRPRPAPRRQLAPARARAFRVEPREGEVVEQPLPVSYLGDARLDLAAA